MLEGTLRQQLRSGLTVLAARHDATEHVELGLSLPAGTACERPEQSGLANFAARGVLLGTERLDFDAYNEALDAIGGTLSARCAADSAVWRGACLAADLPVMLGLLRQALAAPRFAPEDTERLRSQILMGIHERDQDTMRVARRVSLELAFGREHPYGRPANGYQEVVQKLGTAELREFWRHTYGPGSATVVVVGPGEPGELAAAVEAELGVWATQTGAGEAPANAVSCPAPPPAASAGRRDLQLPGKTQTDIAMAVPTLRRRDEEFEALSLANLILGRLGLGGRIGHRVRDQLGLAYYCFSAVVGGLGPSPWILSAGVNPARVELALQTIQEELDRLREEPVSGEELEAAVGYARGSLAIELEEPGGLADTILRLETQGLGLDYVQHYLAWLERVSADALQAAARRYLDPEAISVVTAGPPIGSV